MRGYVGRLLSTRPGRWLLVLVGTVCVGLGILGILLPLLPTTPFLLLGAALYARSSDRMHNWLLSNRWFGRHIRDYREGKGIPARAKVVGIALLWVTIGCSAAFVVSSVALKVVLAAIALGVTVFILSLRPRGHPREGSP
jgi:uncharacterized membrane protein YbaN (DUF454 family)